MHEPICNILVIAVTAVVSYLGFRDRAVVERYVFEPERILAGKEYYRLVTSSLLHADWRHLVLNLVSLYLFGRVIELWFGKAEFLLVYFGAVVGGDLLSLYVHRHHEYRAYGASGGVCGVIFAYILLFPGAGINVYFAVPVPGWLYALGFMLGSFFAMKAARDNIGHDAHLGGAIVGLLIAAGLHWEAVRYNPVVFLIVLSTASALLVYLWVNPMFLPVSSFGGPPFRGRRVSGSMPKHRRESLRVDAILEKVGQSGIESLSAQEKALLEEVSGKYRRRADSSKPESGLTL